MGAPKFLYEVLPDLFPYDFLSEVEISLWAKFLDEKKVNDG